MIKKIIPLIVLSLCSCKKDDKKGSNGLLNENDTPNAPIKAYIKDLMCKYPNNWPKIFAALKKMQVGKLLSSDQQILINNRADIKRDLGNTPNLLNYFYQLTKTSSLDQAKNPDTRNFTTEQARIRRELYDLMSNIASEIFSYNTPILLDFQALLVMCFSDQKGREEFFNNREDIKNVFKKTTAGGAEETFNYKKFPLVFDLKLVKGNIDDKEKKKILENIKNIIWEHLIQIIKNNVKVITFDGADKGMKELKGIKKDRFIYDTKKCNFPLTSATEVAIMDTCQMFGINYDESFSKVETKHNTEEIKNFCLAFSTYVLKKFGCKFGADKKLKCENDCGLLSSHHPLCFLSHQVLGIVWAIINTSLEKVEKIDTTIDFVLDLSGTFECDMKETEIREAVRNSLFGGTGFYAQDGSINEWHTPFKLQDEDFKGMNGYATLDYRYIINFLFYQCFGDVNANSLLDITHAAWQAYKTPALTNNAKNTIFKDIIRHEGNTTDFALATFSILNAMSTKDGRSGGMYLFGGCDNSKQLIDCVNNATANSKNLSEKVYQQCTTTKWQQIIDREGKSDLYSAFLTNMLIPLWNEFVNRNKDAKNQYKIIDIYKIEEATDIAKIRDFYFQMLYRTYEALGTYCLLDAIYKKNSVTWKIYNN